MKKKVQPLIIICLASILLFLVVVIIVFSRNSRQAIQNAGGETDSQTISGEKTTTAPAETHTESPTEDPFLSSDEIIVDLLPINEFSRPGTKLEKVNGIVIHYVGNPRTTAAQNRSYFGNLAQTGEAYASSNYIIGLQGEIIQCVPNDEVAYASNERNWDTISIECCHATPVGDFNFSTYNSLVKLCAALCKTYGLNPETDVLRHYDVSGKECPIYYVKNPDEWYELLLAIRDAMQY